MAFLPQGRTRPEVGHHGETEGSNSPTSDASRAPAPAGTLQLHGMASASNEIVNGGISWDLQAAKLGCEGAIASGGA
jgi:hypothetical protein